MHLWTEYEGNTLAGYPLGRLTRSEGRSAFFLTSTPEGQPATLRLTESHFDEGELIGRWHRIAAVTHPNLQAILHSGQTTFDNVPLACCLLEPADASLSDVLRERALSTDETKEVAEAAAGALAALHAAGLVHEHIDATNVFAMGEVIKLRSDCARECTGDFEADTPEAREALRQRDVHDLGLLLLRCLTMDWQGTTTMPLPGPFNRLVPGALDGIITADGIVAALNALKPAPLSSQPAAMTPNTVAAPSQQGSLTAGAIAGQSSRSSSSVYTDMPKPVSRPASTTSPQSAPRSASDDPFDVGLGSLRNESRLDAGTASIGQGMLQRLRPIRPRAISRNAWIATGAVAAMLGLVLWNTVGSKPASTQSAIVDGNRVSTAAKSVTPASAASQQEPATAIDLHTKQDSLLASGAQAGWHVIAYTYNYEQQAQAKAIKLQRTHFALQPQVFTPTGHAPYFVALGGPSDATAAMALRNRARQAGLPRDTYARNF